MTIGNATLGGTATGSIASPARLFIRTLSTGDEGGASTASRTASYGRGAASGGDGGTMASRVAIAVRSAATGDEGASAASRTASYGRSAASGGEGASAAGRAFADWALDPGRDADAAEGPTMIAVDASLSATAETLSLSFVAHADHIDHWRERFGRAGAVDTEVGFAGAFRATSRDGDGAGDGNGDAGVVVEPPADHRPPFVTESMLVDGYDDQQTGSEEFEVELILQRRSNRRQAFDGLDETSADGWEIETAAGTIAPATIGRPGRVGSSAGVDVGLPMLLSGDQAAVVMDALGFPDAVVERQVDDGQDRVVDESGGRQTITVSSGDETTLQSGEWLVRDWSIAFHSADPDARWRAELSLIRPPA